MAYKMMSPNTAIWWVPLAGLTTPSAPKATEINAGTNMTLSIETGYTLGATDPDVDNSRSIGDEGTVETPTIGNYQGSFTFFRDDIGTGTNAAPTPSTIYTTVFSLFKAGPVTGWIVSRHGKKYTSPAAANDVVSVFKFTSDYYKTLDGDKGTPIRYSIAMLPQGEYYLNVKAAA